MDFDKINKIDLFF